MDTIQNMADFALRQAQEQRSALRRGDYASARSARLSGFLAAAMIEFEYIEMQHTQNAR